MKTLRLHVVGMPHTVTTKGIYTCCAFTQLIVNFCKMMTQRGHTVIHYGAEGSDPVCAEHVTTITREQQQRWFKYDWASGQGFPDVQWDGALPCWRESNAAAIAALRSRLQPDDFICIVGGHSQKAIADAFPQYTTVEYAIGYEGTFAQFRCFASRTWQHHVYGIDRQRDGSWYDAVIPHYFDPDDFALGQHDGGYYLYLGRLITRKNPHLAAEVCQNIGARLVLAGNGVTLNEPGKVASPELTITGDHIKHVGPVDQEGRNRLLGGATALFAMTNYIGMFEMVAVEAMLAGTAVIVTDWGAFPSFVREGIDGFRVHTMGEMMEAARLCPKLDHERIRREALERFSLDAVAPLYEAWFSRLLDMRHHGWYSFAPGSVAVQH